MQASKSFKMGKHKSSPSLSLDFTTKLFLTYSVFFQATVFDPFIFVNMAQINWILQEIVKNVNNYKNADQMSQRSQASFCNVLWLTIVWKNEWQDHLLSCSRQLKKTRRKHTLSNFFLPWPWFVKSCHEKGFPLYLFLIFHNSLLIKAPWYYYTNSFIWS